MRLKTFLLLGLTLLTACAPVEKKGILVDVEPGTPMEESDLRQHCDLGDHAACVLAGSNNAALPDPRFPIVQGVAPADRAVFTALIPKNANVFWYVFDKELNNLTKLFTVKPISRGDTLWAVQRVDVRGLVPGRSYDLLAGDPDGRLLEDRKFRTLANDERSLRLALIGGWRFASHDERSWLLSHAFGSAPQLLLLAGSAVSATLPPTLSTLKGREAADFFFARHAEARSHFELALTRDLLPIATLWNDDEFGRAGGDRAFVQHDQARDELEIFFPHWADEETVIAGPGTSLDIQFRHWDLIIADDLSFRKAPEPAEPVCTKPKGRKKEVCRPGTPVPPPVGTRYGGVERNWVADRNGKSDRPLWILASGPTLLPFSEDWVLDKTPNSPTLTSPPRSPWLAVVESVGDGTLRLTNRQDVPKIP